MKTHCKHLKQKLDRTLFCKTKNRKILVYECNNCKFKEYKSNSHQMKKRTNKLSKLERNRFSIIDNKNKCIVCKSTYQLTWHEIYRGRNRRNSMKYGLCLRLCINCHELYQENKNFNDYWHIQGQKAFMKYYDKTKEDFRNIFKQNYL